MAKKPKLEHSELSGEYTEDGVTVLVDIFRPAGTQEDWKCSAQIRMARRARSDGSRNVAIPSSLKPL
ncbi:hypothetical protein [Shinella sp.]|jgi:hypothetical protein|uniref:hypothetical protein n=1 Tax=Shinella sp. TaxID=1870904 RepID=UPI003F6FD537